MVLFLLFIFLAFAGKECAERSFCLFFYFHFCNFCGPAKRNTLMFWKCFALREGNLEILSALSILVQILDAVAKVYER